MSGTGDHWDFWFGQVDGKPSSTFLNLSLARDAPIVGFADCVHVSVRMRFPKPNGLSSKEEFDILAALEDDFANLVADRDGVFVGRITHDGQRDFFAYFRNGDAVTQALLQFRDGHRDYAMESGARADPQWQIYGSDLYPPPAAFQQIRNRAMLLALQREGDDLTRSRRIDHYALFPDTASARTFAGALTMEGFREEAITDHGDEARMQFWREDAPHGIDLVTDMIISAITDAVGRYDGWECEVIRASV